MPDEPTTPPTVYASPHLPPPATTDTSRRTSVSTEQQSTAPLNVGGGSECSRGGQQELRGGERDGGGGVGVKLEENELAMRERQFKELQAQVAFIYISCNIHRSI